MNKRQRQALQAINYNLFAEPRPAPVVVSPVPSTPLLPTEEQLQHLFSEYNKLYFEGSLPAVTIEYSDRMKRTAGACIPMKRLIRLGRPYHQLYPDEISDTLKHEMIHLRYLHHNAAFKQEARRLGASLKARNDPRLRRPPRYVYRCPGCGAEYPRQKRLRMASCGSCSVHGKFDERFKLKQVKK